jgi:hypothetical protein
MTENLALARLPDGFTGKQLTDNVQNNSTLIINQLNELYTLDNSIFAEGVPDKTTLPTLNASYLNRQAYLWLNAQFKQLQVIVNSLVSQYNEHGIVGEPDYTDTTEISLWLPTQLALNDDFRNNINLNWTIIENKLNDCLSFYNNLFVKEEN